MKENTIKAMNLKELAAFYEVSIYILRKWIKPHENKIGQREGFFFTPQQVKTIFEILGEP